MMHHSNGSAERPGDNDKTILEQVEDLLGKSSEKQ